jgi:hypothetical protein
VVVKKEDNHYVHVQLNEFNKYKTWEPKVRFYTVIVLSCPLIALSVAHQPIREELKIIVIVSPVMPLVGGQGGLKPTRNLGVQLTKEGCN